MLSGSAVVVDQGISSASNFLLAAAVVRYFDLVEIGMFSLAVAFIRFSLDLTRAGLSEPLLLLRTADQSGGHYLRPALRTHFVFGALFSIAPISYAAVAWNLGWASAWIALSVAAVIPVVICHDAMRFMAFATVPTIATAGDLGMFLVLLGSIAVLPESIPLLILVWGLASAVSLAIGASLLRDDSVQPLSTADYQALVRPRGRVFFVEAVFERGLGQATLFAIAVMVGVAGAGQIHSGRLVYGFLNIALMGLAPALTPILVRRTAQNRRLRVPLCIVAIGSTLVVLAVSAFAWLDPWEGLSRAMADGVYWEIRPLLPWIGGGIWLGVLSVLLNTYFRVADLIRLAFATRLGVNLFVLGGACLGAASTGGPLGVVAGMTIARGLFFLAVLVLMSFRRERIDIRHDRSTVDLTIDLGQSKSPEVKRV